MYSSSYKAFKISEEIGVSSCYIYKELADLYEELGNTPMKEEYNLKYIENGGLIVSTSTLSTYSYYHSTYHCP